MMGDAARTRQASVRYRYAAAMSAPPSAASSARAATRAPAAWRRSGRHRGQLSGAGRVLSPARPSSPRWACAPRRRPDRPDARRRRVVAVPALALTRRLRRPSLASPTMSELRFPGGTSTGRAQHRTTHKSRPFSSCAQRPTSSRSQSSVLHVHAWRARLRAEGYEFVRSPPRLEDRQLRVMLGSRLPITAASVRRFTGVWPRALRSARLDREGSAIEVHAVHVPNGSTNGWVKIDHLHAIRRGLQPPHPRPQILCGDFNTPQSETGGQLTTFGQTLSGRPRQRPPSHRPFTAERPWDPLAWDQGERAVVEGLPRDCDMPDAFHRRHPTAVQATWVPRGAAEEGGRRLDHLFATTAFDILSCRHIHQWRHDRLSDHSAIEAHLRLA